MHKPQFSLVALLGLVTFAAIGCAALARPHEWWASGLVTLACAAVVAAALAAALQHGRSRAFAGGFALVGGAYLLLVFGPGFGERIGPWLLTSRALAYAEAKWQPQADGAVRSTVRARVIDAVNFSQVFVDVDSDGYRDLFLETRLNGLAIGGDVRRVSFLQIGQALWTMLFALLGGLVARRWAAAASPQ